MDEDKDEYKNKNAAKANGDEHAQPGSSATTMTATSTSAHHVVDDKHEPEPNVVEAATPPPAKVLSPEETRTALQTLVIMGSLCAVCSLHHLLKTLCKIHPNRF